LYLTPPASSFPSPTRARLPIERRAGTRGIYPDTPHWTQAPAQAVGHSSPPGCEDNWSSCCLSRGWRGA
jgi:hypothetical protein